MSSLKGAPLNNTHKQGSGNIAEGVRECVRAGGWGKRCEILSSGCDMTAMLFMISQQLRLPAQKQVNQHFSLDGGGSMMSPPTKLMVAGGEKSFFFFEYVASGKVTMLP